MSREKRKKNRKQHRFQRTTEEGFGGGVIRVEGLVDERIRGNGELGIRAVGPGAVGFGGGEIIVECPSPDNLFLNKEINKGEEGKLLLRRSSINTAKFKESSAVLSNSKPNLDLDASILDK